MLLDRCAKISKQILEYGIVCHPLEVNVRRSFYRNHGFIDYFIQYLRKREMITTTRPDGSEKVRKKAPKAMIFKYDAPNTYDFMTFNIGEWWKRQKSRLQAYNEKLLYKEYTTLGADLSAAKLVLMYGGKVKFKNHDEWIDPTKKNQVSKLPTKYDHTYILDGLDLNGHPLQYENLHIIFNLYYLKHLSFKGCKTVNDWTLDRISGEFPMLEELDVSECENVTERGLEALYRMPNLTKLIVTNHYGSAAFDLTCLLLEDINPHLKCQIQQPKLKRLPPH